MSFPFPLKSLLRLASVAVFCIALTPITVKADRGLTHGRLFATDPVILIVAQPVASVMVGSTAVLRCLIVSTSRPDVSSVQWQFGSVILNSTGGTLLEQPEHKDVPLLDFHFLSFLQLKNVSSADSGVYSCFTKRDRLATGTSGFVELNVTAAVGTNGWDSDGQWSALQVAQVATGLGFAIVVVVALCCGCFAYRKVIRKCWAKASRMTLLPPIVYTVPVGPRGHYGRRLYRSVSDYVDCKGDYKTSPPAPPPSSLEVISEITDETTTGNLAIRPTTLRLFDFSASVKSSPSEATFGQPANYVAYHNSVPHPPSLMTSPESPLTTPTTDSGSFLSSVLFTYLTSNSSGSQGQADCTVSLV